MLKSNINHADYFRYNVYGMSVLSDISLALPEYTHPGLIEIEICSGSASLFSQAIHGIELENRSDWHQVGRLHDASTYVRWQGLGEFLVTTDGRRIICARAPDASMEAFQVYLLGQALGFALVKSGFEPLHATSIDLGGQAFAVLGSSGFGKSSLAACFLAAGHSLLTDDLLLLQPRSGGGFDAYPGPPRIKLFPEVARHFFGPDASGVCMNWGTNKLVMQVSENQSRHLPLRTIYVLESPSRESRVERIRIEPLPSRAAFLSLIRHTFNYLLTEPDRLRRQAAATTCLVSAVPVKRLSYPSGMSHLPAVREAILSDRST